jgi:hypothetical protein
MSSPGDERNEAADPEEIAEEVASGVVNLGAKKRKLQRACDVCRRRKGICQVAFNVVEFLISHSVNSSL